jgi:hypothetical protein
VPAGRVAVIATVGAVWLRLIAVPVPSAPVAPTKYSAAVTSLLPVAASLAVPARATGTVPSELAGLSVRPLTTGPALSRVNEVLEYAPQFPSKSWART